MKFRIFSVAVLAASMVTEADPPDGEVVTVPTARPTEGPSGPSRPTASVTGSQADPLQKNAVLVPSLITQ